MLRANRRETRTLFGSLDDTRIGTCEHIGKQGQKRECEENLELIRATNPFAALLFAAAPALKIFGIKFAQIVRTRSYRHIDAGCLESDLLEERAVELAPNLLPLVLEIRFGLGTLRDPRTMIGIAQADGKNRDVALGGDRRRLERIRLLVVAVGDQQDRLIALGPGVKHFECLANRVADGCAASRCTRRVELIERSAKGIVIDRERALHHRLPRERDQSHAFPFEPVDQGRHVGLGPAQPAGRNVFGEHRPRDVDQHIKIATAWESHLHTASRTAARRGRRDP